MATCTLMGRSLGGEGVCPGPSPPTPDFSVPPRRVLHPFIQLAFTAQRPVVERLQGLGHLLLRQEKSSTGPLVFCRGSGEETGFNTNMAREADLCGNLGPAHRSGLGASALPAPDRKSTRLNSSH